MRLNLGCAEDVRPGYLSLDLLPPKQSVPPEVFRQGDAGDLDGVCADGAVDEILALNVLPRFPGTAVEPVLAHWLKKLKPGGVIKLAFPDLYVVANLLAHDALPREQALTLLFGPQDSPFNIFRSGLDVRWVVEHLTSRGCVLETKAYEGAIAYVVARKTEDGHVGHAV